MYLISHRITRQVQAKNTDHMQNQIEPLNTRQSNNQRQHINPHKHHNSIQINHHRLVVLNLLINKDRVKCMSQQSRRKPRIPEMWTKVININQLNVPTAKSAKGKRIWARYLKNKKQNIGLKRQREKNCNKQLKLTMWWIC